MVISAESSLRYQLNISFIYRYLSNLFNKVRMKWIPYADIKTFPHCAFRVKYSLDPKDQPIFQGVRFNWIYEGDPELPQHVIWPEFEDLNGKVILEGAIPLEGTARMYIIFSESQPYHQSRLKIGVKGYIMSGPVKKGQAEIIEVLKL